MRKLLFAACFLLAFISFANAQESRDTTKARALTMEEYEKAKTFSVGDPDKDTYVKFDNTYILDHGAFGKPYFITGDDGKKKRIDLYKLILKEGRVELGTVIYYTTDSGKRYTACMPGYKADPKVWGKYFEDIHAIDKQEPFYVLKLSYVLSEELGFQLYKSIAAGQGKEVGRESGTYGTDICFPGDMQVTMADGTSKPVNQVQPGDEVVTVDPATHKEKAVRVKELTVHAEKNYAITRVTLLNAHVKGYRDVVLSEKVLEATPNHPMLTKEGPRNAGSLRTGDKVWCPNIQTGGYTEFTVWDKTESAGGMQHVYNIVAGGGSTFLMNGVMVMQKAQ